MPFHAPKDARGLPRYDGVGAAVSALGVSADTRRAAQEADAWLPLDDWSSDPQPATTLDAATEPGPASLRISFTSLHLSQS